MAIDSIPEKNLLGAAKSREIQRAVLAEMRDDRGEAGLHFLAAAHMELVLAVDYALAGESDLALRSRLSAGSCFWRAGRSSEARDLFDTLIQERPDRATEISSVMAELAKAYPALAS